MSTTDDIKNKFGNVVLDTFVQSDKKPGVIIQKDALKDVCVFLKESGFDHLSLISGVDMPADNKILMVYHFWSYTNKQDFVINAWLDRNNPKIPTLTGIWRGADWMERETYDLVGVTFEGHPNHVRILLPDAWNGHPLRKDYDMNIQQFIAIDENGEDIVSTDPAILYRKEALDDEN